MESLTYLAVLEPPVHANDGYSIFFPDLPGCTSLASSLAEAPHMAAEAASLQVYGMECDGDEIPTPSADLPLDITEGNIVMPVTIFPELYKAKRDNERVKTNTTLPAWLKRLGEKQNVNFSRLLEGALLEYLNLSE